MSCDYEWNAGRRKRALLANIEGKNALLLGGTVR